LTNPPLKGSVYLDSNQTERLSMCTFCEQGEKEREKDYKRLGKILDNILTMMTRMIDGGDGKLLVDNPTIVSSLFAFEIEFYKRVEKLNEYQRSVLKDRRGSIQNMIVLSNLVFQTQ